MSISAIILAAGQSRRMGQPKMLLPWGNTTVLGRVIETIQSAGIEDILVVTGGARAEVEKVAAEFNVRAVHNGNFERGEMLASVQLGLQALLPPPSQRDTSPVFFENGGGREGALICLGDQPQIKERSVRVVCEMFLAQRSSIVVPSYQMRRGHPWLIARELWGEVLQMRETESMRDFLNKHGDDIYYIEHDSPDILQDLDTPDDYLKHKP